VLDGVSGQRHALAALYPRENIPGTHWIGDWVGFRAGLNTEARGKSICPCWGSNRGRPVCSQIQYWLSYPTSPFGPQNRLKMLKSVIYNSTVCVFMSCVRARPGVLVRHRSFMFISQNTFSHSGSTLFCKLGASNCNRSSVKGRGCCLLRGSKNCVQW
jgi:hypothetical protein